MPLYEYQCAKCREICEVLQKVKDKPLDKCPKCGGGPMVKRVSSPAIQFKGNGWYITDYAKKSSAPAGHAEDKKASPAAKSEPASETKPAAKPAPAASEKPKSGKSSS